MNGLDAGRVLSELRELAALTADEHGAQRVAFEPGWERARAWLREKLAPLELEVREDAARNLWARLPGPREPAIAVGSHLDSVPNGGWLDGALGVLAALEVLRAAGTRPPRSLVLVDWADEEGRFGHSLLGSSAATGTLDAGAVRAGGGAEVLDLGEIARAADERPELAGYLELHIEQGPILERAGEAVAAVSGTFGVRRDRVRFAGRSVHAGATPMDARRDPVLAAARFALAARSAARNMGGLATVGRLAAEPGTPTAIAASCTLTVDVRHADAEMLDALHASVRQSVRRASGAERCEGEVVTLWSIDPIEFDPGLVAAAHAAAGRRHEPLVSGPLHDAAALARAGVPTAMLFVRSKGGVSHSPEEDSDADDLRLGVEALGRLAGHASALA